MSIVIEPTLTTRFQLLDDAKPAEDAHWYWPLPRLAGETPRILAHANDGRRGVDLGYMRLAFPELFVPVFAARSGTISFAAQVRSGFAVTIDHGGVWSTHYAHLERTFVLPTLGRRRRRARVRTGDVIGYAARDPSHVRFEVWRWTSRDGYVPVPAERAMRDWLVLPQFTRANETAKPGHIAA
jgi:murein DD-endopeptidase MepM/ murein hydrolase activator NlpD